MSTLDNELRLEGPVNEARIIRRLPGRRTVLGVLGPKTELVVYPTEQRVTNGVGGYTSRDWIVREYSWAGGDRSFIGFSSRLRDKDDFTSHEERAKEYLDLD